jgi:hypothetical protein
LETGRRNLTAREREELAAINAALAAAARQDHQARIMSLAETVRIARRERATREPAIVPAQLAISV